jgi:hypothetical protein
LFRLPAPSQLRGSAATPPASRAVIPSVKRSPNLAQPPRREKCRGKQRRRLDTEGRFALTPASDLLRTAADGSARGVAVGFLAPPLWQSAGRLAEIVRNPEPVNPAGLMVIDYVLPDGPEPSLAHLMDLIMMVLGGRERTRDEHEALLGPEGYTLVRDTPLTEVLPWRVLEFERR